MKVMEILITLRNINYIEKYKSACDGFIVGSYFSSGYGHSIDDLRKINRYCKTNNLKLYITIENFISEDDKPQLINYIDFIKSLNVDGICFHDLGVYDIAKSYDMLDKLIYDGQTIICNSLDVAFYKSKGVNGVVLSRELTLEEITDICKNNLSCCDVMVFGHQRLSYSKRKFLTNYFKEVGQNYDFLNKQTLTLIEEKRNYKMPIVEDENGTKIYSDYIFQMYEEMPALKPYINRGIIDTLFINDTRAANVARDYRRITNENCHFLYDGLNMSYPDNYSTGYLHQKTNITKDE